MIIRLAIYLAVMLIGLVNCLSDMFVELAIRLSVIFKEAFLILSRQLKHSKDLRLKDWVETVTK